MVLGFVNLARLLLGVPCLLWRVTSLLSPGATKKPGQDLDLGRDGCVGEAVEAQIPWYHQEEYAHPWRDSVKEKP